MAEVKDFYVITRCNRSATARRRATNWRPAVRNRPLETAGVGEEACLALAVGIDCAVTDR
jgi:hypothetical protein